MLKITTSKFSFGFKKSSFNEINPVLVTQTWFHYISSNKLLLDSIKQFVWLQNYFYLQHYPPFKARLHPWNHSNKMFYPPKTIICNYLSKLTLDLVIYSIRSWGGLITNLTTLLGTPFGCDLGGESLTLSTKTSWNSITLPLNWNQFELLVEVSYLMFL